MFDSVLDAAPPPAPADPDAWIASLGALDGRHLSDAERVEQVSRLESLRQRPPRRRRG